MGGGRLEGWVLRGGANFTPTSAAFGKITGKTGDVRNMQLSLRFFF